MSDEYSALDRPDILSFVFYPRRDFTRTPPEARDHFITVEEDVSVSCRYYVNSGESPSVLYFHGNGEVVNDYDHVAPMYNELGLNLFVADYRGYGASQGRPTLRNTVSDACSVLNGLQDIIRRERYCDAVFVMGRSLGSMSAIEIACRHQEEIRGLIIESGFAAFVSLLAHLGLSPDSLGIHDSEFPNLAKMRTIGSPTLIMHGENDGIIPASEAQELFRTSAAVDKRLLVIPGAGHNDIMWTGRTMYFRAIKEFTTA